MDKGWCSRVANIEKTECNLFVLYFFSFTKISNLQHNKRTMSDLVKFVRKTSETFSFRPNDSTPKGDMFSCTSLIPVLQGGGSQNK